jgi:hypothetical protein
VGLEEYLKTNQKIDVTVWKNDTDEGTTFYGFIKDCKFSGENKGSILVSPPPASLSHVLSYLKPGLILGVATVFNQKPVLFYPLVQSVQRQGIIGIWLGIYPDTQYEVVQRRKHVRIAMSIPIKVETMMEAGHFGTFQGITLNVSGGGVRFASAKLLQEGQPLHIHMRFSDEIIANPLPSQKPTEPSQLLKLPGEVVFSKVNAFSNSYEEKYVTGVRFVDLNEQQESIIVRECFRRELGMKRSTQK